MLAKRVGGWPLGVRAFAAVGIDLGTTNSCVAVMEGGQATVIANAEGNRTTPSIVAYTDSGQKLVGVTAKRQAVTNHDKTLFATKRLIGRKFNDASVQEKVDGLPYKIVKAKNGDAWIQVDHQQISPSQVGALILQKMKETAETYLGHPVTQAVITVPAYFDDVQRQGTKDAGTIAGLEVLRIINEPTAAALAYGVDKTGRDGKIVAVYDLGGGTFDVSILEMNGGVFEVKSTNGNSSLGGEDIDKRIVSYLAQLFEQQTSINVSQDKLALQRLREAAEIAKLELSSRTDTEINLPFLGSNDKGPQHLRTVLTRAKLEDLVADLLNLTIEPCERCLRDAKLKKEDVDEVLLVGGMTRMPKVQEIVKKVFGKSPSMGVNPDEAVAVGAAIQAGVLKGEVKDVLLLDVIPLSLGIETMGGVFTRLIDRNTTIPTRKSSLFSTAVDNQDKVGIKVFQGEREMASANKALGQFDLTGIPPAPRGVPQIEVVFDIDANGILNVSAMDKTTNKKQEIMIQASSGLSKSEIEEMIKEAEKFKEMDETAKEKISLKNDGETLLYRCEDQLKHLGMNFSESEMIKFHEVLDGLKKALGAADLDAADVRVAMKDLQEISWDLSRKYYSQGASEE